MPDILHHSNVPETRVSLGDTVVTAHYWLDIDKADADNGGGVIGNYLSVQLLLSDYYSMPGGALASISLAARLENKN